MVKAYRFQRLMIIAALIVWAGFAAKIVVGGIKGETSNVSDTFCENVYYDLKAEISGVGKLGSRQDRLGGRSADKMMLVAIADKLGISLSYLTKIESAKMMREYIWHRTLSMEVWTYM